jgi:hypothetical protein
MNKLNSIICAAALLMPVSAGSVQAQNQSRWADASRQLAMVVPVLDVAGIKQSALVDFSNGQFSIAAEKLKRIVSSGSATADDYFKLGEAQFRMAQFEVAAENFGHARSLEESRVREVEAYIAANKRDKAATACTANLALPGSAFTASRLRMLQKIVSKAAPSAPARKGAAAQFVEKQ